VKTSLVIFSHKTYIFSETVNKLVSDSVVSVNFTLERLLDNGNGEKDKDDEKQSMERYLRLWDLLQSLSQHDRISRNELVNSKFKDCPLELDHYEKDGLISYITRPSQDPENAVNSIQVAVGLPRLKIAFQKIINDEQMKTKTEKISKKLKKKKIRKTLKELTLELDTLHSIRKDLVEEQAKIIENASQYVQLFGQVAFDKKKESLLLEMDTTQQKIQGKNQEISHIEKKLEEIEH
jgi:hypothetical protein